MTREQGQFDEGFSAHVVRKDTGSDAQTVEARVNPTSFAPLTAGELGAMLCRIKATRIGTGEEILIILSAADWQALMDMHGLEIFQRKGGPQT